MVSALPTSERTSGLFKNDAVFCKIDHSASVGSSVGPLRYGLNLRISTQVVASPLSHSRMSPGAERHAMERSRVEQSEVEPNGVQRNGVLRSEQASERVIYSPQCVVLNVSDP